MILPDGLTEADFNRSQWVYELWEEMKRVQPGMTRAELLQVFKPQGGISHNTQQSFLCRRCRFFLMAAEFELYTGADAQKFPFDERDVVKQVSPIYVGLPHMG